jgi:hypothetical protein
MIWLHKRATATMKKGDKVCFSAFLSCFSQIDMNHHDWDGNEHSGAVLGCERSVPIEF